MMDQQYCDALKELESVKAERDALTAHVDGMERRGDQMAIELRDWLGSYGPDDETERMLEVWEEAKSRRPEASLARMRDERAQAIQQAVKQARREWAREDADAIARQKLLCRAETLEEAERYAKCEDDLALLRINAAELRRQAEEVAK